LFKEKLPESLNWQNARHTNDKKDTRQKKKKKKTVAVQIMTQ
jgi:hypothetical protein